MLETRAIVVQVQGVDAIVEAKDGGGCGQCSSAGGCGSSNLSKMFCSSPRRFRVRNDAQARVGDEVLVVLADGVLLRSAFILYLIPLAMLFAGGALGVALSDDAASRDGYAALGAGAGLLLGLALAKWLARFHRGQTSAEAVIQSISGR